MADELEARRAFARQRRGWLRAALKSAEQHAAILAHETNGETDRKNRARASLALMYIKDARDFVAKLDDE